MEPLTLLFLLMAVLFGSYIQTVTGFAMGMIIIATVGGLGLLQLSVLAILVSLLTSVNSLLSLRGNWSLIDVRFLFFLALGQFPAIVFGIGLLNFLESNEVWILKAILGSFLVLGGLLSFINPRPLKRISGRLTVFLAGILGGTLGGLFSASGPVLGLFAYSQPMPLAQIRATLLASFLFTTTARTAVVSFQGSIKPEILMLFLLALPIVLLGTFLGKKILPPVSESTTRRFAFSIILMIGFWTLLETLL